METYGDDDLVLVLLGDHQPANIVSGEDADHDVPITLVTRDPEVVDRIAGWGWQDGMRPAPGRAGVADGLLPRPLPRGVRPGATWTAVRGTLNPHTSCSVSPVGGHMPGDEAALMQQLHDEHAAALWGYCLRLTGHDRARAEDVVQETLLRAWRHREILDNPPPAVRGWLFTVARNIVIDEWRSRRARSETPVADVPKAPTRTTAPTSCCSRGWSPRRSPGSPRSTAPCCWSATTGGVRSPRRPSGSAYRKAR